MPIYEYQCVECKNLHEIWQKITERPIMICPDCGGQLHKLVSLSSFQLKGGGWYVDGYTNKPLSEPRQWKKDARQISRNQAQAENGAKAKSGAKKSPFPPAGA
jgi:putative FmdB family regulatory protein